MRYQLLLSEYKVVGYLRLLTSRLHNHHRRTTCSRLWNNSQRLCHRSAVSTPDAASCTECQRPFAIGINVGMRTGKPVRSDLSINIMGYSARLKLCANSPSVEAMISLECEINLSDPRQFIPQINRNSKELICWKNEDGTIIDDSKCYRELLAMLYSLNGKTSDELNRSALEIYACIQQYHTSRHLPPKQKRKRELISNYKPRITVEEVRKNIEVVKGGGFIPIHGFSEYEMNGDGIVRNIINKKTIVPNRRLYPEISLRETPSSRRLPRFLHRIIAFHFVENPEGKALVDHIDDNPRNYHRNNLQWLTTAENNRKKQVRGRTRRHDEENVLVPFYQEKMKPAGILRCPTFRVLDDLKCFYESPAATAILKQLAMSWNDCFRLIAEITSLDQYQCDEKNYRSHNQLPLEVWKKDPSISDQLKNEVSNYGRVRNWVGDTLHQSRFVLFGYPLISVGKRRYLLHERVAMLFLPQSETPNMVPLHINRVPHDNRASNLVWASREQEPAIVAVCRFILEILNSYQPQPNYLTGNGNTFSPLEWFVAGLPRGCDPLLPVPTTKRALLFDWIVDCKPDDTPD